MSAADFLLSPTVQKLLMVTYAEPSRQFSVSELVRLSRLGLTDVEGTLPHLVTNGILTQNAPKDGGAAVVGVNASFVFYAELRSIALKSFAAAEPLRAMLKAKFKDSVLQAFIVGEDGPGGSVELLIVHGVVAPDESALKAALQKLVKTLSRQLQVHVLSNGEFLNLRPSDPISRKLAGKEVLEIITRGDTKARLPMERVSLLRKAKNRLASLAS